MSQPLDGRDGSDASQDPVIRFEAAAGLRLVAACFGPPRAPAVLLSHGGGQTRHAWSSIAHRLVAAGYRVICPDLRGHGDSDWPADGDYSVAALSEDLVSAVGLADGPVALVGASAGGLASFHAAARLGRGRVRALTIIDIGLMAHRRPTRARTFMLAHRDGFASLDEAAAAVAAYDPHRSRRANPAGLMKNLRVRADGRLRWHWDPRLLDMDQTLREQQLLEAARRLDTPTLLLKGGDSDVISPESLAQFQAAVPTAEVQVVPGAGHMISGDDNDGYGDHVIRYLARVMPPA
jgi:pimeloyl-ACP methyl ester carboxylesterase